MARPQITLISPNKIPFLASWVGDERTVSKKLGIFELPAVKGAIVQDLDVGGDRYPLTIYFTGAVADLLARQFVSEIKETGSWTVIHPVIGTLTLQPISITDQIQPVDDIARRVFTTEWIEPIEEGAISTLTQVLGVLDALTLIAEASTVLSYAEQIKTATFGEIQALQNAADGVLTTINKGITFASRATSTITNELNNISSGITSIFGADTVNGSSGGSAIQKYVTLPTLGMESVEDGFSQYNGIIEANFTDTPTMADNEQLNKSLTQELALSSCIISLAQIATISGLKTRVEAIGFADQLVAAFESITTALDESQTLFADTPIDRQYFSQSQSYTDLALLVATAAQYLLTASLDLQVEKRFTLDREQHMYDIVVQEYGTLGPDEANVDLFIDSNKLKGDEFCVLPAGREIVVYV